ncbi:TetR/AcrR family transcriptional regulator; helix-turn-helix transcriptional regulator [Nocardia asteroides]|nr:TetR/AcrR family transcriptional regulator; helix-turn-helix transcriptional regulator [Nocardia asteroides]
MSKRSASSNARSSRFAEASSRSTGLDSDGGTSSDTTTRTRILRATFEVLGRRGHSKLSLSDVAAEAKVSRPKLYRLFSSKEELLAAFGSYEQRNIEEGLRAATEGLTGHDRLDAVLHFIVDFQDSYSLSPLVAVEPDHVLSQITRVIPIMRGLIAPMVEGDDAELVAATIVRLAVSHYLVAGDDQAMFLAQLRHAAGIEITDPPELRPDR